MPLCATQSADGLHWKRYLICIYDLFGSFLEMWKNIYMYLFLNSFKKCVQQNPIYTNYYSINGARKWGRRKKRYMLYWIVDFLILSNGPILGQSSMSIFLHKVCRTRRRGSHCSPRFTRWGSTRSITAVLMLQSGLRNQTGHKLCCEAEEKSLSFYCTSYEKHTSDFIMTSLCWRIVRDLMILKETHAKLTLWSVQAFLSPSYIYWSLGPQTADNTLGISTKCTW